MRLRIFLCLLLAASCVSVQADAALVTTYWVGFDLGLSLRFGGGLAVDKTGDIWFGARFDQATPRRAALCRLDPDKDRVTHYRLPTNIDEVGALAYDAPRNIIWFADTERHSLCKFQISGRRLTVYWLPVLSEDMPNIQSIDVDGYGRVFCALHESDAIGVFDPTKPTVFTMYPVPQTDIEPYSLEVDPNGEYVSFTSGPNTGGWLFGTLDLTDPSSPEVSTTESTGGAGVSTICIKADGTNGKLFMTALGANALGVYDWNADTLTAYSACSDMSGMYGLDLENGSQVAWAGQFFNGSAVWIDTLAATGTDVPLIGSAVAEVDADEDGVPRPWVYQISPKVCSLEPSYFFISPSDECDEDEVEEFTWSPFSLPGAVAVKEGKYFSETWVADIFEEAIVRIIRW